MKRNQLIPILCVILVSACAQHTENAEAPGASKMLSDQNEGTATQTQLAATPRNDLYSDGKAELIKTANYRFQVDDVKKTTEAIAVLVRRYPAYISGSSLHLENPILENKMTIRVQSVYFDELMEGIDRQARFVNFRDVTTEDVSKDFVDLESRLKTKREIEARYMDILRKNAGTIEALLKAEHEIGILHEEIEATISRINFLRSQVAYSTISLEFYQTIAQDLHAADEISVGDKFRIALRAGWNGVIAVSLAVAYLWPLLLAGAGALLVVRFRSIRARVKG